VLLSGQYGRVSGVMRVVWGDDVIYGSVQGSMAGRVGGTGCEATAWVSPLSVACRVARGSGGSLSVAVTVAQQVGSSLLLMSYDAAGISSVSPVNVPSRDGATSVVRVFGRSFGASDYSSRTVFSGIAFLADSATTVWTSDSSVTCAIATSIGRSVRIIMTVALRVGTRLGALSYDAPSISSIYTGNAPSSGIEITISGSGFGASGQISTASRLLGTSSEATVWISSTSLVSRFASGSSQTGRVVVTAGVVVGTTTSFLSYDRPEPQQAWPYNIRNSGRISISITGAEFAFNSYSQKVRITSSACEASAWISDSHLTCRIARGHATRNGLAVIVTSALVVGTSVPALMSYDMHNLARLNSCNAPSRGGLVSLTGSSFGFADMTLDARVSHSACESTLWVSDQQVMARIATGFGGSGSIVLTVSREIIATMTETFSYNAPNAFAGVRFGNQPQVPSGSTATYILLHGDLTGQSAATVAARIGGSACASTAWVSETTVMCRLASGASASLSVSVTVGLQVGTVLSALSYDALSLFVTPGVRNSRSPLNSAVTGGVALRVLSDLGHTPYTASARLGGTACESTVWSSATSITCAVGSGTGGSKLIAVTVGMTVGSLERGFSYDTHSIMGASPGNTRVSTRLIMNMSVMHLSSMSPIARVSGTACEVTVWNSETSITCIAYTTQYGPPVVTLTAGLQVASLLRSLSYDAPQISNMTRIENTSETYDFILEGSDYGSTSLTAVARIGGTACMIGSTWLSDTAISVKVAPGIGSSLRAVITLGLMRGTLIRAFSYDPPIVTDVDEVTGPSLPTGFVLLVGRHFGHYDYSLHAEVGSSSCDPTLWVSDTAVRTVYSQCAYHHVIM
jgi:hypothetical protein